MRILFHDDHFIAVNKPPALLVHRSRIDLHEIRFALQMVRDMIGRRVYPLHRLDKPASGVLLLALRPETADDMMRLFATAQVAKTYLAVVRGHTPERGVIDYALKEEADPMTDARADQDKAAQAAVTEYLRIATAELAVAVGPYPSSRYSLLRVRPRTGRRHQIRRHLKHIFHPIIGDTTHGDGKHNALFRTRLNCHRLLLHAWQLTFIHPYRHTPLTLCAPLDEEFRQVCARLGWEVPNLPPSRI